MAIRHNFKGKGLQVLLVLVPVVVLLILVLQKTGDLTGLRDSGTISRIKMSSKAGPCSLKSDCPADSFSFLVRSGAANVVPPRVCLLDQLVLGEVLNNVGPGINIVLINGSTGGVLKTGHFDMYGGEVKPLLELLEGVEAGSVALMASYDDPSTRLTKEARQLISDLGSSSVTSLGFRDNWVFVGGKGSAVHSNFEKLLQNNKDNNKYENWPELIEIQGCIPRYLG